MMKINKANLQKKLGVADEQLIKMVLDFQKKLPILNEDGEGFCINARDLHRELVVNDTSKVRKNKKGELVRVKGNKFSDWIKERIEKYEFVEDVDYICVSEKTETQRSNGQKGISVTKEYKLTIEMAKELSMIENNATGKLARKYFIAIEKILKLAIEWEATRQPEKESWLKVTSAMDSHYLRVRGELPSKHSYMNEANAINRLVLGDVAKKVREIVGAKDSITRDWLPEQWNDAIYYLEEQDVILLNMDMKREERWDFLTRMFKAKYPNLRPYKEVYMEQQNN